MKDVEEVRPKIGILKISSIARDPDKDFGENIASTSEQELPEQQQNHPQLQNQPHQLQDQPQQLQDQPELHNQLQQQHQPQLQNQSQQLEDQPQLYNELWQQYQQEQIQLPQHTLPQTSILQLQHQGVILNAPSMEMALPQIVGVHSGMLIIFFD